jgi:serine/threonine-protein kinase
MLRLSAKRIAALVVSRYGGDRGRVQQTLRAVLSRGGGTIELLGTLTADGLLTSAQAEKIRGLLDRERARTPPPFPVDGPVRVAVPSELAGCRLLRCLGEGGMGAVYLAYHEAEKRQVAIKVLAPDMAENPVCLACFYREAKSSVVLDHPNLVRGLGAGHDEATNLHYLVREFVDGPSSHTLLDHIGRLPVGDVARIGLDVARALDYLHGRQFVHRDVKPDNILLSPAGAKLTDLGLVQRLGLPRPAVAIQGFGTSWYMPREQENGPVQDGRGDIFALGATLYHLLTGQVPFPGDNHQEITARKELGNFAPAREVNPDVPAGLDAILSRMLARSPEDRYPNAAALIADLEATGLAAASLSCAGLDGTAPPADTSQPTTFDLRKSNEDTGVWYLRYRDTDGRMHRAKATTRQLLRHLRSGRMPPTARASAERRGAYHPLTDYPLFRGAVPSVAECAALAKTRLSPPDDSIQLWRPLLTIAVAAGLLAALGALFCYLVFPY